MEDAALGLTPVAHAELADSVNGLALEIAAHPGHAVVANLELLDRGKGLTLAAALALEAQVSGEFEVDTSELWP